MRQNGLILRENFKQTERTLQTQALLQEVTSFSTPFNIWKSIEVSLYPLVSHQSKGFRLDRGHEAVSRNTG